MGDILHMSPLSALDGALWLLWRGHKKGNNYAQTLALVATESCKARRGFLERQHVTKSVSVLQRCAC